MREVVVQEKWKEKTVVRVEVDDRRSELGAKEVEVAGPGGRGVDEQDAGEEVQEREREQQVECQG